MFLHERIFTFKDQPENLDAWAIGEARHNSKAGGDFIDGGLSLLKELQDRGYGIFKLPNQPISRAAPEKDDE